VIALAARFRKDDQTTPLILMGYANPVHSMGYEAFAEAAAKAGIDGSIIVDLAARGRCPAARDYTRATGSP
jgi:tryptophan synthase alpha chain